MDTTKDQTYLKDNFLIAMPSLSDSMFANTITYLCEHTSQGAMGIVINHPLDMCFDEVFEYLKITNPCESHNEPVMAGGPVEMNRGFVLHRQNDSPWESSLCISNDISLTTSLDVLEAIAHNKGPKDNLIALGYAGWGAGQLEQELANNAWLTLPADADIIFNIPIEQRLKVATSQLGIDWQLISPTAGHA